jgi:serine phosphatase RsbU (regulator of sigma subunit)
VKDGMDISLLCINRKKKVITWAGANNPLWYIAPGRGHELAEIKANKQPIGKVDNPLPFTTHLIPYEEGMIIYLITDGYADQFGGPKGKKFKYKQLEDLILENQSRSLPEQKEILTATFFDWKKEFEQVDDVTLLAVKI